MAHNVGEDAMNWPSFMYVLPSRSNSFRSTTCAKQIYLDDSTLNQDAYPNGGGCQQEYHTGQLGETGNQHVNLALNMRLQVRK